MESITENIIDRTVQGQVGFNRVPEKVPRKVPGGFGAEPGQVQQGFRRRFRRRSGKLWCRAKFNRVPEKVLEKVPGGFGEPGQVQQRGRSWRLWCRARTGVQLQLLKRLTSDAPLWGQLNTSIYRLAKIYSISYSRT